VFLKIRNLLKKNAWKEQLCGVTGIEGSFRTNFYKEGKVMSVSLTEEGHMDCPDDDELEELFGTFCVLNQKNTKGDSNGNQTGIEQANRIHTKPANGNRNCGYGNYGA